MKRITNYELRISNVIIALLVVVGFGDPTYASTLYVDSSVNKQLSAARYAAIGVVQPNYEWRFVSSDGLDYDTLGSTGGYRNYGQTSLSTQVTDSNRPALTEGILQPHQGAETFNGSTNYLIGGDEIDIDSTKGFSIGTWVRIPATSVTTSVIFDKRGLTAVDDTPNNPGWAFTTRGDSQAVRFTVKSDSFFLYSTTNKLNDDLWHYVSATLYKQAVGASCSTFVDGVKVSGATLSTLYKNGGHAHNVTNSDPIAIGRRSVVASLYFGGDLALIQIWSNVSITHAEWQAIYAAQKSLGTVASPKPTIQSAIYAATAGDTILINSGRYQETVVNAKALDYVGATTPVFGSIPELYGAVLPAAAGTNGFTNSAKIGSAGGLCYIDVRGYSGLGIKCDATSDGTIVHHVVVDSCLNGIDFDGAAGGDSLINCVIDGGGITNATGFRATTSSAVTLVAMNNIIVNTKTAFTKAAAQTLTETNNDFYGNTTNYASALHATDLTYKPFFRGGNDYRPQRFSRVLNAGTLIRLGVTPFNYVQNAPPIGVWDLMYSNNQSGQGNPGWARGSWGR
jgi:hypothetical protein